MIRRWGAPFAIGLLILVLSYQNCARVTLVPVPEKHLASAIPPFSIEVCSEEVDGENYHFQTAIVFNMNARPFEGALHPDTDGDGLRDADETGNFSSTNRYSINHTLDSLCARGDDPECGQPCDDPQFHSYIQPGINLCDINQFAGMDPDQMDSDGDGLPSFFEILRGGYPDDASPNDGDRDGATVNEELLWMTDPFWADSPESLAQFRTQSTEIESPDCTFPKRLYKIDVPTLPRVDVQAFTDTTPDIEIGTDPRRGPISLSHGPNENVYLIVLEMRGLSGSKFLFHRFLVGPGRNPPALLKNPDFF